MDIVDDANELVDLMVSNKIREATAPQPIAKDCRECGDLIPQARQEATGGTDMCVECKTYAQT